MPEYSIIIPAHNEGARIRAMLADFATTFSDSEIIVVANGCTDNTAQIVNEVSKKHPHVRLIEIGPTVGKGGAIRAGFLTASAPITAFVDSDGSTSAQEMRRLCSLLHDGVDGVIASRWLRGADIRVQQSKLRRVASRLFNFIVRVLFRLPYSDTQCGAKVYRSATLAEIMYDVETSNFACDVDMLYNLRRRRKRIIEVPTRWQDVTGSKVNLFFSSATMLAAVLRLRLRYSLLRYLIPVFDKYFPTNPIRARNGLAVLVLGSDDPTLAAHDSSLRALYVATQSWASLGHIVHWIVGGVPGQSPVISDNGVAVTRIPRGIGYRARVARTYLTSCRDRFDVVLDLCTNFPALSALFSLKPKLLIDVSGVESTIKWPASLLFRLVKWLYHGSPIERIGCLTGADAISKHLLPIVVQQIARPQPWMIHSPSGWYLVARKDSFGISPGRLPEQPIQPGVASVTTVQSPAEYVSLEKLQHQSTSHVP